MYIRLAERVNSAESYLLELETLETEQRQPHIWPQKRQANTTEQLWRQHLIHPQELYQREVRFSGHRNWALGYATMF